MERALLWIASGIFAIATAMFLGLAMQARGDEAVLSGIATFSCGLFSFMLFLWGFVASFRERWARRKESEAHAGGRISPREEMGTAGPRA